ncbi:MAG: MFS transporter [Gammaproteobacteria bacterium]
MAGFVGNIVEWYDFALYGYMASFLSTLFFPGEDRLASLLATYGVFAAGFVMRPLGSALFGWFGDTFGRTTTMLVSGALMALPTFALGCLPTYETAGVWAAVLLVLVRLAQGLSVGGEFSSSVTYLVETAKQGRRGFAGSWANVGSVTGMLLGSGAAVAITSVFSHETVLDWAWRLPFLFGAAIGLAAILIRRRLPDSEHFRRHRDDHGETSPLRQALTRNLDATVKATVFASMYGVVFYFAMVYLPTWAAEQAGYDLDLAMRINAAATAVLLLLIPLAGWLSDRVLRRTHLIALAMAGTAILGWPLFAVMAQSGSPEMLALGQFALALLVALPLGAAPAMFVEMFPASDRLSGYSVSYNLGLGVVGGATPMIATGLIKWSGSVVAAGVFLTVAGAIGIVAAWTIRDRSRETLR